MRRLISYAGTTVALSWVGEDAAGIAAFLFSGYPEPVPGGGPPAAQYHCGPGCAPGRLALVRDGVQVWEGEDHGAGADAWQAAVSYDLADHSRGGLLFHAAALRAPCGGVILPGAAGSGKSTLALRLALSGCSWRTDELVYVREMTLAALPAVRPLSLKRSAVDAVRGIIDLAADAGRVFEHPGGWLVSPALLSPETDAGPLPWSLVVFPHWEAGAAFALERLSKAQAGLELMQCCVNARNLAEHGFPTATRLAAAAPAYRLRYGAFEQLGPLDDLLSGR
jgi:hypothetical protein